MLKIIKNPALIILLGLAFPFAAVLSPLMPLLLAAIMTISFLDISIEDFYSQRFQFMVMAIVQGICALTLYVFFNQFWPILAIPALLMALTPTAISAPAISSRLNADPHDVAVNVVASNLAFSAISILLIWVSAKSDFTYTASFNALISTAAIIVIPYLISLYLKKNSHTIHLKFSNLKNYTVYLWLFLIFVASAAVSEKLIFSSERNLVAILTIGVTCLFICLLQFFIGKSIYRNSNTLAQSLTQKNTVMAAWFALTFLPDYAALAPILYSLIQNTWFSLIMKLEHTAE